ncbi:beta-propeller domain-containing protein [Patescibacteria group bacterium]
MGENLNTAEKSPEKSVTTSPLEDTSSSGKVIELKDSKDFKKLSFLLVILLVTVSSVIGIYFLLSSKTDILPPLASSKPSLTKLTSSGKIEVSKFSSAEEFSAYLEEGEESSGYFGLGRTFTRSAVEDMGVAEIGLKQESIGAPTAFGGGELERVSETNVQVKGIDEPDIVKTNGEEIYYSQDYGGRVIRPMPMLERRTVGVTEDMIMSPPMREELKTKVINAFPPADLAEKTSIDKAGELLLVDDVLVIFTNDKIYGYDVSDPQNPSQKWTIELKNRNYLASSRLYQDKLYLIVGSRVNRGSPCPIVPFIAGGREISVRCTDIYYPRPTVSVDVTFTAMKVDVSSGDVDKTISFIGSSSNSLTYMSKDSLYVTYSFFEDMVTFMLNFYSENKDLISLEALEKIEKLSAYDISSNAKMVELQTIIEEYQSSLDDDERLKMENEMNNRMQDYTKEHKRELEQTGLVKIDISDFDIAATGSIPGRPLNQFSLDEYKGDLRIATTVGQMFGRTESANDVYVLDDNLKLLGSVLDLGLGERIYSARFIEDKGYLVTFRQIDPFYVLDLSNPKNPEVKGELKIPGYSSYLHPIDKDKILGIGKEDNQVKLSLFDVSSPEYPEELDKYLLEEYWSDVLNTHHAFLLDSRHEIFFLPGSKGGYVFSYKQDKLSLQKAVSNISAQRALFINDYLYIVGRNKIVILNELDWLEVNSLDF